MIGGPCAEDGRPVGSGSGLVRRFGVLVALCGLVAAGLAGSALAASWIAGGSDWVVQPTPDPTNAEISYLAAVACRSGGGCLAVGGSSRSLSSSSRMLAERWNGNRWQLQAIPTPRDTSGGLSGVACPSARWCMAVGYVFHLVTHRNTTLAEIWNGKRWRVQSIPTARPPSSLYGVSCTSPSSCVAVGHTVNTPLRAIVERWNGSSWRTQHLPRQARATALSAVSCARARGCEVVGWSNGSGGARPVALGLNGSGWRVQRVPQAPVTLPFGSARAGLLDAVSCTSPSACTATGADFNNPSSPLLAERWNGTAWRVQRTPNPVNWTASLAQPSLEGVSCAATTACTTIGEYDPGDRTQYFIEFWNGRSWRLQPVPHPADFAHGALLGISCRVGHCTTVGAYTGAGRLQVTLAVGR